MSKIETIKISVIIPSYNAGHYIKTAIQSAIDQTEKNIEIIVCDDVSTDNTIEIIREMMQYDGRIQLIQNTQNQGPSYSRNYAIKQSKGEWIALLDADDYYHQDRLAKLLVVAENEQADFVADNLFYVDTNDQIINQATESFPSHLNHKRLDVKEFVENDSPSSHGLKYGYLKPMIRRTFIIENSMAYDETVRMAEDSLFYINGLLKGAVFVLINDAYYFYRVVTNSLSRSGDSSAYITMLANNQKLLNLAEDTHNLEAITALNKRNSAYLDIILYYDITKHIKNGQFSVAFKLLLFNPLSWSSVVIQAYKKIESRFKTNF
jgi:succinoglycan biosynthesis protein ExoO